ncbi:MAG: hypothetical protein IH948_02525, partial [Bacteroidetes bacterium]|nr:hypothetical protein [Bacteroidota bacterium]
MFKRLFTLIIFVAFSLSSYATHIVGGALTYVHNGGSSYTITLKLYRGCDGVNLPNNADVVVDGYDGASFNPSKDLTLPQISTSFLPANLDTCADPPNPIPCVEEGIYELTVTNLSPNYGGYHLYYQEWARNLNITNTDASCNCIGESFYAYIPGASIWNEDFSSYADGTTIGSGAPPKWTRTLGTTPPTYARVENNRFEFSGEDDADASWISEWIDISAYTGGVFLGANVSDASNMEASDSIVVQYSLDGGPLIKFAVNGVSNNDFGSATAEENGVIGDSVQIVVTAYYGGNSGGERLRLDDVLVTEILDNDNPVFTGFPPLFL